MFTVLQQSLNSLTALAEEMSQFPVDGTLWEYSHSFSFLLLNPENKHFLKKRSTSTENSYNKHLQQNVSLIKT